MNFAYSDGSIGLCLHSFDYQSDDIPLAAR